MASGIVEQDSNQSGQTVSQGQVSARPTELAQRLIDAPNLPAFVTELITTQANTVAGTEAAGFLIERAGEDVSLRLLAHLRGDGSDAETRAAAVSAFQDLVKPCIEQGKDGAIDLGMVGDSHESQFCLVTLLRAEGETVAVSAVIARCLDVNRATQRLTSMKLVAGYFELFSLRRASEQSRMVAQSHQHVLQLSTSVATAEGFESAAMNLCNELATRAPASRVSLGWVKGTNVRVRALSHTEEFDKKQELIVGIERVMEECADQDEIVQFDPNGQSTDNVTREAAVLSRSQGGHAILSLPLRRRSEIIGVITLEFSQQQGLGPNVANALAVAVDLLAPQLYDRYQNDRWLITKIGLSAAETPKLLLGPQHTVAKLIGAGVILAILIVTLVKPMYHVSAPFQFAPLDHYSLSAPFEGFIETVGIGPDGKHRLRPGDAVRKGTVLLKLQTRDMRLKLDKALAEANARAKEADKYRGEGKTAEAAVAGFEHDQAQAEADLYQDEISRAVILAPMDGMILKGDLEEKEGSQVKTGDVLFEVGDPTKLRAELNVADRDIQELKLGQKGKLATNALPDGRYDFVIDRIIPLPDPKDGTNNFKVYATLTGKDLSKTWRPGMEGEARVEVAPRRLVWIWTHRLVDFVKLKLWI